MTDEKSGFCDSGKLDLTGVNVGARITSKE